VALTGQGKTIGESMGSIFADFEREQTVWFWIDGSG
jgi:hypothetical protein